MRLSLRMIATAAAAVFLIPALVLRAQEPGKPPSGAMNDKTLDSRSISGADSSAPSAKAMPDSRAIHHDTPKVEWFLGYSYLRAVPTPASGNRLVWLNGGSTSVAFNFNRYFGIVGDFGGFRDSELLLSGTGGNSSVVADSSGYVLTYLGGPRLSFFKQDRLSPFVQALFGGVRASEVTLSNCTGGACTLLPTENKFAMTAGGGLDLRISHHFAIRLVQAEYLMTRFEDRNTGNTAMQNDLRLSSGIVFRFGGNAPPPPPAPVFYSCSVNPSTVFPGDTIAVSGTAQNLNPAKTAVYTWSADGGTVSGTSNTAQIDTASITPGAYTLKGHVSEGDKSQENADCAAQYTVKAFEPPTVSCSADPSSVISGGSSTITATGVSPQNRPLSYSYSSASGSIAGTGQTATLSTTGAAAGVVNVTCNVADDKGQTASGTTSVTVGVPVAAGPATSSLCSIRFERDTHRPSRVDNEAKACLDEVALSLQHNSDATVALIGNVSSTEEGGKNLASQRALNTKAYLVNEKGLDPSRIALYTGSQDGASVTTTLIPTGATFDGAGDTPVDERTVHPATAGHHH